VTAAALLALAAMTQPTSNPLQIPSTGRVERLPDFASKNVSARNVDVWLPEGYDGTKKHNVLYMHDGQMLFDPNNTWNKQEWQADEVMGKLIREKKVPPTIIVGVWNSGVTRFPDYFPAKSLDKVSPAIKAEFWEKILKPNANADAYLKFLAEELKPYIDSHYSVFTDPAHTGVAGSSMGGLISMYAFCEKAEVFGRAGCLSSHWPIAQEGQDPAKSPIAQGMIDYLEATLGDHKSGRRIWFDYGDQTLDAQYEPWQKKADAVMTAKGWKEPEWKTVFYKGHDHSEKSWAARLDQVFEFLLGS
jgi:enterochelin esterase-like enzyme